MRVGPKGPTCWPPAAATGQRPHRWPRPPRRRVAHPGRQGHPRHHRPHASVTYPGGTSRGSAWTSSVVTVLVDRLLRIRVEARDGRQVVQVSGRPPSDCNPSRELERSESFTCHAVPRRASEQGKRGDHLRLHTGVCGDIPGTTDRARNELATGRPGGAAERDLDAPPASLSLCDRPIGITCIAVLLVVLGARSRRVR